MSAALHHISNWRTVKCARAISLRLTKEEAVLLKKISEREDRSPDVILCNALRKACRAALGEPVCILVSEEELESLCEDMRTPPSEEVLKRCAHLMTYERWTNVEREGA